MCFQQGEGINGAFFGSVKLHSSRMLVASSSHNGHWCRSLPGMKVQVASLACSCVPGRVVSAAAGLVIVICCRRVSGYVPNKEEVTVVSYTMVIRTRHVEMFDDVHNK